MIQQHILGLAKQGDVDAIAALLNQELKPQGFTATVGRKQDCLYISLEAEQVPEKLTLVSLIREQLNSWHLQSLSKVKLYGRKIGQSLPVWQEEIELELTASTAEQTPELPPTQIVNPVPAEIGGKVFIGSYVIQMGSYGAVVYVHEGTKQQRAEDSKFTPVFLLPPGCRELVGRYEVINEAIASLKSRKSVEFYGVAGVGKSVLLRYLAQQTEVGAAFADGVISFDTRYQPTDDRLQFLFDAFYETENTYKPTEKQIRQALQHKQALLILDYQKLTQDDLEQLINSVPRCTLLLASVERHFWGEVQAQRLRGLTTPEAQILAERELQRSLTSEECQALEFLSIALEGTPWKLLLVLASVRLGRTTLLEQERQLHSPNPSQVLIQQILTSLEKPQQVILGVLAALPGIGLQSEQVAAISHIDHDSATAILQSLLEQKLVELQAERYSLNHALGDILQQKWDLTVWQQSAFQYFTTWAQQHLPHVPSSLDSQTDAIIQLLEWGVEQERWSEVLLLAKSVENSLVLSKQWGLWQQVLLLSAQAAQELGDKAAVAWALHQMGTRALCLEDMFTASDLLSQALHLREALGDEVGTTVTRHNLNLIKLPQASLTSELPVDISFPLGDDTPRRRQMHLWLGGLIVLLCSGLAIAVGWSMLPRTAPVGKQLTKPQKQPEVKSTPEAVPLPEHPIDPEAIPSLTELSTPSLPPPPPPDAPLGAPRLVLPSPKPEVPGSEENLSPKPQATSRAGSGSSQPTDPRYQAPSYSIPSRVQPTPQVTSPILLPPAQTNPPARVIYPPNIPTVEPTPAPTAEPTPAPTAEPTPSPTAEPTPTPTAEPTPSPSVEPTPSPSVEPTTAPAVLPPTFPPLDKHNQPSEQKNTSPPATPETPGS